MQFTYRETTPSDKDFSNLVAELSSELRALTSDSGENSFHADSFSLDTDICLVIYQSEKAVACGSFRKHDSDTCELKRMYSKYRGAGSYLITQLESCAVIKGYKRSVLSTRKVNDNAVCFYERHGYSKVSAYGKYVHASKSVCLGKSLAT
ncbi:GNAT family N-acetyltransferase [Vibrio sp. ZSDZ65]|uniref:GNAT family N-acetyltransferase n=1 Tax=Vibrio qingdaonensis TaxID=2829491 RepID=A0A9X3HYU0_9VIBR|nr:GNAT family N-acetyltransferase [Vibrio qingdaonensis]MCW8349145.1 GNAT family N-acetyltransferase [Vibrio qingdaonensis]